MQDYFFSQEQEHYNSQPSSEAEWDRYDAELGAANRGDTRCWILSDRDVWYRNPFYTGPLERHPEDDTPWSPEPELTVVVEPEPEPETPEDDIPF
jgi:hypothetical protein